VLRHVYFKQMCIVRLAIGECFVQKYTFGHSNKTRHSGNTALGHAFSFRQLELPWFRQLFAKLTAEARFRSPVRPCGICGGPSATVTCFWPRTSGFRSCYHSTSDRYVFSYLSRKLHNPSNYLVVKWCTGRFTQL